MGAGGGFVAGSIIGKLLLDKTGWNQSIASVGKDQEKLGGMSAKISDGFKKTGKAMTMAGIAIVGAIGGMVKAAANFDQAMTESLAIMGNVSKELRDEMRKTALDMSTKSTFSAKELGQAYYFLASAGLDAEKSIRALPIVTKFAQAGAFDLSVATSLLTDAQSALGLKVADVVQNEENMIRVSDNLVKANTLADASVLEFAEALTNKASASIRTVN